jgi:organic radical activating enzyme
MLTFEMVRIDEINEELKEEQENGLRINIERNKSITSQNTLITTNTIILKDNKMSESKELYTNTDTDFDLSKPVILNTKKNAKNEENVKNNKKK